MLILSKLKTDIAGGKMNGQRTEIREYSFLIQEREDEDGDGYQENDKLRPEREREKDRRFSFRLFFLFFITTIPKWQFSICTKVLIFCYVFVYVLR